jgi:16S rRNA processing protein RimM
VRVVVARVGRAHGLRGDVALDLRTDDPATRLAPGSMLGTDPAALGPLTVERVRWHGGRLLVAFAEVTERSTAERLKGTLLAVEVDPRDRPADPEEFYDYQLVGLTVLDAAGRRIGVVSELLHLPGQDVLVVRRDDGRQALVPFVAALVPEVDVEAGRVVVDPPPGLLDLEG